MGFLKDWIALVMSCITIVNYAILVNGKLGSNFLPFRGLRQGDLLSPYLFLFCAKSLSSLISKAENKRELQGVAVARDGNKISHLLFVGDRILFYNASLKD